MSCGSLTHVCSNLKRSLNFKRWMAENMCWLIEFSFRRFVAMRSDDGDVNRVTRFTLAHSSRLMASQSSHKSHNMSLNFILLFLFLKILMDTLEAESATPHTLNNLKFSSLSFSFIGSHHGKITSSLVSPHMRRYTEAGEKEWIDGIQLSLLRWKSFWVGKFFRNNYRLGSYIFLCGSVKECTMCVCVQIHSNTPTWSKS